MPLQNRVDPFGVIQAVSERGTFTGNRGIIHDPATKRLLRRRWTTKAWIICTCQFRGRRRDVMGFGPNGNGSWTELFFLDEVTALAAGHRPCFYCRRSEAADFVRKFAESAETGAPRAGNLDRHLHAERLAAGNRALAIGYDELCAKPDGVMVSIDGSAHAKRRDHLLPWAFSGYGKAISLSAAQSGIVTRITPESTSLVLAAGYEPVWHRSAGS